MDNLLKLHVNHIGVVSTTVSGSLEPAHGDAVVLAMRRSTEVIKLRCPHCSTVRKPMDKPESRLGSVSHLQDGERCAVVVSGMLLDFFAKSWGEIVWPIVLAELVAE